MFTNKYVIWLSVFPLLVQQYVTFPVLSSANLTKYPRKKRDREAREDFRILAGRISKLQISQAFAEFTCCLIHRRNFINEYTKIFFYFHFDKNI